MDAPQAAGLGEWAVQHVGLHQVRGGLDLPEIGALDLALNIPGPDRAGRAGLVVLVVGVPVDAHKGWIEYSPPAIEVRV